MPFTPIVAVKNSDIPVSVGEGNVIGPLASGYPVFWGQGYYLPNIGINTDGVSGFTAMLSTICGPGPLISEFNYDPGGVGVSQNVGGYNSGNSLFMLPPYAYPGDGTTEWQVGYTPQLPSSGINPSPPAPTISVVAGPDASAMTMVNGQQGVTDLGGLSGATMMMDGVLGEVYLCETDFASITFFNAFQLEAGETTLPFDVFKGARWLYDGAFFWLIYVSDVTGELILISFVPQTYGGGFAATKYSVTFDDPAFNAALLSGDFQMHGITPNGFMFVFLNQVGSYANMRFAFVAKNGLSYNEYVLSGDAQTEADIIAFGMSVSLDNTDQFFMIGIEGVGFNAVFFSPFSPASPGLKARNPQPVKLECSNYCIPLLKQRK